MIRAQGIHTRFAGSFVVRERSLPPTDEASRLGALPRTPLGDGFVEIKVPDNQDPDIFNRLYGRHARFAYSQKPLNRPLLETIKNGLSEPLDEVAATLRAAADHLGGGQRETILKDYLYPEMKRTKVGQLSTRLSPSGSTKPGLTLGFLYQSFDAIRNGFETLREKAGNTLPIIFTPAKRLVTQSGSSIITEDFELNPPKPRTEVEAPRISGLPPITMSSSGGQASDEDTPPHGIPTFRPGNEETIDYN